ncbi:hypothetical protein C4587_00245 [Candidatus Parcubacteria bacterium]|nr:MAG: hypothetical protein C4587_00245 [Candidatus Parcubacteria bacterium]
MKGFFRKHYELALAAAAIALVSGLAVAALWGTEVLSGSFSRAFERGDGGASLQFDLDGVKALQLKGLK